LAGDRPTCVIDCEDPAHAIDCERPTHERDSRTSLRSESTTEDRVGTLHRLKSAVAARSAFTHHPHGTGTAAMYDRSLVRRARAGPCSKTWQPESGFGMPVAFEMVGKPQTPRATLDKHGLNGEQN
jgi:hypothetical protein